GDAGSIRLRDFHQTGGLPRRASLSLVFDSVPQPSCPDPAVCNVRCKRADRGFLRASSLFRSWGISCVVAAHYGSDKVVFVALGDFNVIKPAGLCPDFTGVIDQDMSVDIWCLRFHTSLQQ